MKYMLLIYGNEELWQSFPPEDLERVVAETDALHVELRKSGEFVGAYGMADQQMAKLVTTHDGDVVVTDGPYIEAKEYLGSFTLVDCDTPERAYEIAALNPFSKVGQVEVRPIMHEADPRDVTDPGRTEDLLRELAPQVLGALVRRYGHFDAGEDAVQEALVAAARQWPVDGRPDRPRALLITVASRRLTDQLRSDGARRDREQAVWSMTPGDTSVTESPDIDDESAGDDTLTLLFLCCHPALSPSSQLALTLRAVGGLTTAEIAGAFLVPEATMGQRISRAKQAIRSAGLTFSLPPEGERTDRLAVVLRVLYLIFNEGYTATTGDDLQRTDLTAEAVRLARMLHAVSPDDGEVTGLLALMLLTEARRTARTAADGALIRLDEQDRSRWNQGLIAEGVELISDALAHRILGPYQLQAAIAAVHDEAPTAEDTDWAQILALYGLLQQLAPSPVVTLNRAVALAMVDGPRAGLQLLATLDDDPHMAGHHRLASVRGHLLELNGDVDAARTAYRNAARRTTSRPEQRYLDGRAARLARTRSEGGDTFDP